MSGFKSHLIYEVGDFRLDANRRLLFAKGASDPLPITPKVFETILYFVERPGELLEKDRLLAELWPGLVVEENNLTQVISVVRRVLGETRGDTGTSPPYRAVDTDLSPTLSASRIRRRPTIRRRRSNRRLT